jgi:hypothetical protein
LALEYAAAAGSALPVRSLPRPHKFGSVVRKRPDRALRRHVRTLQRRPDEHEGRSVPGDSQGANPLVVTLLCLGRRTDGVDVFSEEPCSTVRSTYLLPGASCGSTWLHVPERSGLDCPLATTAGRRAATTSRLRDRVYILPLLCQSARIRIGLHVRRSTSVAGRGGCKGGAGWRFLRGALVWSRHLRQPQKTRWRQREPPPRRARTISCSSASWPSSAPWPSRRTRP